ncbi:hypothetical protein [Plasmodium yoelii yoelii]|uniref:Uncharacterized protein n=1 Tax=Plasmodium yoelii yoelii TaxID=73239 RepID=Q7RH62_PLAYO|nr:hypothetical protein [Plasmodium yoelii yoelii]
MIVNIFYLLLFWFQTVQNYKQIIKQININIYPTI